MQLLIITGNLGKDPEVRTSQGGMAVCTFSVGVNERVKKDDEWVDHTEWFRCICFDKTAENVGEYLRKGSKCLVRGVVRQETYKDKDGVEKRTTKVMVDKVEFLDSKPKDDSRQSNGRSSTSKPRNQQSSRSAEEAPPASDGFIGDDLPFMRFEPALWW